jgi:hypothetical protein
MDDKKVYPSQINTKTISLRLPLSEYSKILSESVNLGITMSDYLILKIYNNSKIGADQIGADQPESNKDFLSFTITKNDFRNVYNEDYYYPDEKDINGTPFNEFWNEFSKDLKLYLIGLDFNEDNGNLERQFEDLQDLKTDYIHHLIRSHRRQLNVNYFYKLSKNASVKDANLTDVKTQLTVLIKQKFKSVLDQKEYRKDLFELLKELE